jgi:hypothetical protein
MQRQALREVTSNQLNKQNFQIFQDSVSLKKKNSVSVDNIKPKQIKAKALNTFSCESFLKGVIKLQNVEIEHLRKRCAFLDLVNSIHRISKNKIDSQKTAENTFINSKVIITPKKRRMETQDVNHEETFDRHFHTVLPSTPSRNTNFNTTSIPTTPISILKSSSKSGHHMNHSNNFTSTAGSLLKQFSTSSPTTTPVKVKRTANIVKPWTEQPIQSGLAPTQVRSESLADRLRAVEEHMFKLHLRKEDSMDQRQQQATTENSTTTPHDSHPLVPVATHPIKSEQDGPVSASVPVVIPQQKSTPPPPATTPATSPPPQINQTVPVVITPVSVNTPQSSSSPRVSPYISSGSSNSSHLLYTETVNTPILTEPRTLHEVIQRATNTSMRTLLRDRAGLKDSPNSKGSGSGGTTPVSDALKRYQFNNAKMKTQEINNSLQYNDTSVHEKENHNTLNQHQLHVATSSNPSLSDDTVLVDALETSIMHYHNTSSVTSPLSPLGGEQGGLKSKVLSPCAAGGGLSSTVSLAGLSMYRDKMSSWRDKYN